MSAQGPDGRRIHVGVARGTGADSFPVPMIIGVSIVFLIVAGTVVSFAVGGVRTSSIITSAVLLVLGLAGVGAAWWLPKRFGKNRPDAVHEWLDIGPAGIWWTSTGGTAHYPWHTIGGVRIHSVLSNTAAPNQSVLLDLLGPPRGPGTTAAHAAVSGALLTRILLRIAVGWEIHLAPQLAREVGMTIQATRPDLWRGYTKDDGAGRVSFHSYDRPVAGHRDPAAVVIVPPNGENFGGAVR